MKTCSGCRHRDRESLEQALLAGDPLRAVAARFGLKLTATWKHGRHHLPQALRAAATRAGVDREDALYTRLGEIERRARRLARKAEESKNYGAAIAATRELLRLVELQGKIGGPLRPAPAPQTTNYVLVFEGGIPKMLPEAPIDVTPEGEEP